MDTSREKDHEDCRALAPDDFQQLPILAHLLTSHKGTHQRNHTVSDQPVHTEELGERLRTCARAQ